MNEILTPRILQTIIICCTIIIVGIIAVSAYRINREQQRNWASYIFSASILLVLAIVIFSYCFCKDKDVLDFISLASALISIILAIVTIIYSYFTNSRSAGQIDRLNKAAEDVSNATISYGNSAESLKKNIEKILYRIDTVEQKIDENSKLITSGTTNASINSIGAPHIDKIVEGYVRSGSYFGNLALLASCYAALHNKGILSLSNLNSVFDPQDNALLHYMWGYIISSSAVGVLQARIDGENIVISNVYKTLQRNLEEVISTYIGNISDDNAKEYNQKLFDNVKALFNTK